MQKSIDQQGRLIAEGVKPLLETFQPRAVQQLSEVLARLAGTSTNVKLLFRPTGIAGLDNFFYIASNPPVSAEYLENERLDLVRSGIFEKLSDSCAGER